MPPPSVNKVLDEQISEDLGAELADVLDDAEPCDIAADYEEMGVPRPDQRLSEAFPVEFATYCEHFVDVFPRSPYFVKTTYDPHSRYAGWPEKKSRKTKRSLALIDNGDFLNRTDCVERHLDYEQWLLFKDTADPYRNHKFGDFFWLGQCQPKKTTFHAIDLDNKRVLGHYRLGSSDDCPVVPVVHMPLDHFKVIKRIYDAFPDRIWCITSETLGLDIIERHSLQRTSAVHARTKRRLSRIGLEHTEVHPMEGRCKRRPFGEHYRTITNDRVLETWQQQLAFYLAPSTTPCFEQICRVLLQAVVDQWASWVSWSPFAQRDDCHTVINSHKPELTSVVRWLQDGCPLTEPVHAAAAKDMPVAPVEDNGSTTSRSFRFKPGLPSWRDGRWPLALEQLALSGLPCEDTVGDVVFELAKFLWWVELYQLPEDQRASEVIRLLQHYVINKHNGMVSRWNAGEEQAVLKQVSRCLRLARKVDDVDNRQVFARIRVKRTQGKYRRVISIADSILSVSSSGKKVPTGQVASLPVTSSSPSTYFSVGGLEALETPLPRQIIQLIDGHRGRHKLIPYATRLINHLHANDGVCRIPHRALGQLLGYEDRSRITKYNKILIRAGILEKDHFVRHQRSCGYWLSSLARQIMDLPYTQKEGR